MGIEENEHRNSDDTLMNFPSSEMNTNWDSIVSLSQSGDFGGSSMIPHSGFGIGNQGMVHHQTDSGFGGRNFSEMVSSFGLTECGQMGYPQNYAIEKCSINGGLLKGELASGEEKMGNSLSGKGKKRESESKSPQSRNKGEQRKEMSVDSHDEKRQKIDLNSDKNLRGKQIGKQVKDDPNNKDSAKDDYIHVRARRGQATNSHSLAERVRRERISERMRMLQDLVPGCNKITGKAVMLDEIINYVQSLQQQIEFLSMKLATVNPELNIDIDRILSNELLHSRGGIVAIPGFVSGINSQHLYPPSLSPGPLPSLSNASLIHQTPQNIMESEIHNLLQMGFHSYPAINNRGASGRQKLDL